MCADYQRTIIPIFPTARLGFFLSKNIDIEYSLIKKSKLRMVRLGRYLVQHHDDLT